MNAKIVRLAFPMIRPTLHGLKDADLPRLFLLAISIRLLWLFVQPIDYLSTPDFFRYDEFSDNILQGNYDLDAGLFIAAPLISYVLALFKILFANNYLFFLGFFQVILSALSVVFLSASAGLIFASRVTSIVTGCIFSVYLPSLYFVYLPSQESIFQSLFIICFYYLVEFSISKRATSLVLFSAFFSLSALTKSHILLMLPLLLVAVGLWNQQSIKKRFVWVALSASIMFTIFSPYGIYNYFVHETFIIASSGGGGFFLTSHNDDFYKWVIKTPPRDSDEFKRLKSLDFKAYRDTAAGFDKHTKHQDKQSAWLKHGLEWVFKHPSKNAELILFNLQNHLLPGYSTRFYTLAQSALMSSITALIFIPAYAEFFKLRSQLLVSHVPAMICVLSMILFVLLFYSQNRFRVVTVEPIYVIYASSFIAKVFANKMRLDRADSHSQALDIRDG